MSIVILVVIGLSLLLLGCQRSLIYLPRAYSEDILERAASDAVAVRYSTAEGNQTAFFVPPTTGGKPERVWLVSGGNAALALEWLDFVSGYDRRSTEGFLLVDYPGYGLNEGKPGPKAIRASLPAAVEATAQTIGMPEADLRDRLAVLGHSIGAACALVAAEDLGIKRAVLVSPFTTMTDMARRVVGIPACFLLLHRFDNVARLQALSERGDSRVTIFHGIEDDIIPVDMGRELAEAFPSLVQLHEIRGAGHNDIIAVAEDEIRAAMAAP